MLFKRILLGLFLGFILIQLIPINTENPEIKSPLLFPDSIEILVRNACYDCHSNETKWPWYTSLAPVSWIMLDHVEDGRKHLNFSDWESYSLKRKIHKLEEISEELRKNAMPLKDYKMMHPEAEWNEGELNKVLSWNTTLSDSLKILLNDTLSAKQK